jgi:hypothetical protein
MDGDRGGLAEWEQNQGKNERKRKCALTSTGLLMEGAIRSWVRRSWRSQKMSQVVYTLLLDPHRRTIGLQLCGRLNVESKCESVHYDTDARFICD